MICGIENESRFEFISKTTKKALKEKLNLESTLVSQESLIVLEEFETI